MSTIHQKIPIAVSVGFILVAIGLSGGSLGRHVKWNSYKSVTYYCDPSFGAFSKKLYAYQTLWMAYDAFIDDIIKYGVVYRQLKSEEFTSWREVTRNLIYANLGLDIVCLIVLTACIVCCTKQKRLYLLIAGHAVSTLCTLGSAAILAYALHFYKQHYHLLNAPVVNDPMACYPDEDNVSTGFYMVAVASSLNFCSAAVNVVNIVLQKTSKTVNPV